jgi:5-methylcytosine-specific restriction endonuclease McrA
VKAKEYYHKNRDYMRMKAVTKDIKKRALKKEQLANLTEEEKNKVKMIYKKSHELSVGWQVDHIIPLSRGGLHYPDNLQIVTRKYNGQKSNKLESEFRSPRPCEIYKVEF